MKASRGGEEEGELRESNNFPEMSLKQSTGFFASTRGSLYFLFPKCTLSPILTRSLSLILSLLFHCTEEKVPAAKDERGGGGEAAEAPLTRPRPRATKTEIASKDGTGGGGGTGGTGDVDNRGS